MKYTDLCNKIDPGKAVSSIDHHRLEKMKKLEQEKRSNLEKLPIQNGYILTNDPEWWSKNIERK